MKRHTIRYADTPARAELLLDVMADNGWEHYQTVWGGWADIGRVKGAMQPFGFTMFFQGDETAQAAPEIKQIEADAAAKVITDAAAAVEAEVLAKAKAKAERKAAEDVIADAAAKAKAADAAKVSASMGQQKPPAKPKRATKKKS